MAAPSPGSREAIILLCLQIRPYINKSGAIEGFVNVLSFLGPVLIVYNVFPNRSLQLHYKPQHALLETGSFMFQP